MGNLRSYPLYLSWIGCLLWVGCGNPVDEPNDPADRETGEIGIGFEGSTDTIVRAFDCGAVSAQTVVEVRDRAFAPERTTIATDAIVEWRNRTDGPVTVTSGDESHSGSNFESGAIAPGASHCFEFGMEGTFPYYDEYRGSDQLSGVVEVEPAWR